jgi:hypothetical protein
MKRLSGKLTYANVISTLCLFLLLGGGTAFAASQLGKNSVGSKQIKNGAIGTGKLKKEAVTGAKIKKGSITSADLAAGVISTPAVTQVINQPTPETPRTAPLKRGETMTGFISLETEAAVAESYEAIGASFQFLPPSPIPYSDATVLEEGEFNASCPAVGQAAAGKLCLYTTGHSNEVEPEIHDETAEEAPLIHGFALQFHTAAPGGTYFNGVWVYTAP